MKLSLSFSLALALMSVAKISSLDNFEKDFKAKLNPLLHSLESFQKIKHPSAFAIKEHLQKFFNSQKELHFSRIILEVTHHAPLIAENLSIVEPKDQISDFKAKFELAKLLSRRKKSTLEALEIYLELVEEEPNDFNVWMNVGKWFIAQGNFSKALPVFSAILNKQPLPSELIREELISKRTRSDKFRLKETVESIVPQEDQISEDEARLELARILTHHDQTLSEALVQYEILLEKHPHDKVLILEASRVLIRQKKFTQALALLYPAIRENPCYSELLVEAAHAEQGLSHPKKSQELFLRALKETKDPESVLLDYANTLMMVGSFQKAAAIYQEALKNNPNSLDLNLSLAWTFVSAERYEEAEGMYQKLLFENPRNSKVLESLATLKELEKDYEVALIYVDCLISLHPEKKAYFIMKANLLYKNEDYEAALEEYEKLIGNNEMALKALIGKGKVERKLGQCNEAAKSFRDALDIDPSSIEAQFYLSGEEVLCKSFIQQILDQTHDPDKLYKWASIYTENGMSDERIFYEEALKIDPDFFPALSGLAESLAASYQYQEALDIYFSILEDFPNNSKMMTQMARVLSWGKNYEDSLAVYDEIIALDNNNPVPWREKARVAYWGKLIDISRASYQAFLFPPVDQLLLDSIKSKITDECSSTVLLEALELLSSSLERDSIYQGYEKVTCFLNQISNSSDDKEYEELKWILLEYLPLYRIQKSLDLESRARDFDWENYNFHAMEIYQDLITFSPGNEEALYSYAQDYCNVGLCKFSRRLYEHILNIDPNHNLVKLALERNVLREHPLIQTNYTYWRERGIGQFAQSQIARQQFDALIEWSPTCDYHFRFMQNIWLEFPFFKEKFYPAEGQTIEVDHVFNGYVKGSAGATRKNYFQQFPSRYTGFATLWFNINDYVALGIGYERRNEIYNFFCLKEGIQAKVSWVSLKASSHSWESATTYRHYDYNDENTLDHINLLIAHAFTEDPVIFKLILNANYWNTSHQTRIIVNSKGKVVTVIHPYWTPENYYAGSLTLQFRYNYAWFTYCEAPQRYFDLKVTGADDTVDNPTVQVIVDWKHEFFYHLGFEVIGFINRGRLWNADGFWGQLYYRF